LSATRDLTYANLLRRAGELVGGVEELCKLLEVSEAECAECESWLSGRVIPPSSVLLRVVDLLIDHVSGKRLKR
jgi:hypothetical protein